MEPTDPRHQQFWNALARLDPLWAILSDPGKAGGGWRLADFMRSGEREVALLFLQLARLGIAPRMAAALDFGCGVGRLTQALARRFDTVTGIDVSTRMVDLARRLNQYGPRVTYVANERDDLAPIASGTIDFIYSNITLQHIPPDLSQRYLREFLRVLRPGGVAVFQLPSHLTPADQRETRPMPDEAYSAQLRCLADAWPSVGAGAQLVLPVEITNASRLAWSQPEVGSIRLGNHWFDESGEKMIVQDDARTVLPQQFAAAGQYVTELKMTAPQDPGIYVGELDLVHEGVTWFAHRGSPTLRFRVHVTGGPVDTPPPLCRMDEREIPAYDAGVLADLPAPGAPPAELPAFPMYGIPRLEVERLVTGAGGRLLHVDDDPRAGTEWQSYRYIVRRAEPGG
jgi:SAM-dependent methyltransferase